MPAIPVTDYHIDANTLWGVVRNWPSFLVRVFETIGIFRLAHTAMMVTQYL